jgi:hypothetical protein
VSHETVGNGLQQKTLGRGFSVAGEQKGDLPKLQVEDKRGVIQIGRGPRSVKHIEGEITKRDCAAGFGLEIGNALAVNGVEETLEDVGGVARTGSPDSACWQRLHHLNQAANMVSMRMGSNHGVDVGNALLMQISQREAIVVTAVNQGGMAAGRLNQDAVSLMDIDKVNAQEVVGRGNTNRQSEKPGQDYQENAGQPTDPEYKLCHHRFMLLLSDYFDAQQPSK